VFVKQGTASFADGTLAGSVLCMNRAFHNVRGFAYLDAVAASRMASINPARQIGVAGAKGSIELGKDADLVILHPETAEVFATIVAGKIVYRR
jgi:N-acetylglucosamine-6-phosphate deacetylase